MHSGGETFSILLLHARFEEKKLFTSSISLLRIILTRMKLLYLSESNGAEKDLPAVYLNALRRVADVSIITNNNRIEIKRRIELIQAHDIYLISRHSVPVPPGVAEAPGNLRYICADVGSLKEYIAEELFSTNIPITNWGDAPAIHIAEGTMALMLAAIKDLRHHIELKKRDGWFVDPQRCGGRLEGTHIGIYGMGMIGRALVGMLRPFGAVIHFYDPYINDYDNDLIQENSLEDLFSSCVVISILAGLTEQTRGSVTAELLARLPNSGVVINTGRGAIIDQDALFQELESGRLRAGLDVLDPDVLPVGHPAREWENLILSAHQIHLNWPSEGRSPDQLSRAQEYLLDNITRLTEGKPLRFLIDKVRFSRMT